MKKYVLVKNGVIQKFKTIDDNDMVIVPKLTSHKYLPFEEEIQPSFDYITQALTDNYEIQPDKVMRVWSVTEKPFLEAQQLKTDVVEMETIDKIKSFFGNAEQEKKVIETLKVKDETMLKVKAAKTNDDIRKIKDTI